MLKQKAKTAISDYMAATGKSQKVVAKEVGVAPETFSGWMNQGPGPHRVAHVKKIIGIITKLSFDDVVE